MCGCSFNKEEGALSLATCIQFYFLCRSSSHRSQLRFSACMFSFVVRRTVHNIELALSCSDPHPPLVAGPHDVRGSDPAGGGLEEPGPIQALPPLPRQAAGGAEDEVRNSILLLQHHSKSIFSKVPCEGRSLQGQVQMPAQERPG